MEENKSNQNKRRGLSFLTIAFIIAVITIFVFYIILGDAEKNPPTVIINDDIVPAPAAIYDYLEYIEERDPQKTGLHEYTSKNLHLLAASLTELVHFKEIKDVNIITKRNKLLLTADYIQINPKADNLSDSIKDAFLTASDIIISIQKENFPSLSSQAQEVLEIAEQFNSEQPLLNQEKQVQLFFQKSADIIETMLLIRSKE